MKSQSSSVWKHCFNPKVLIGLGVVAVLLFFIFPNKTQAGSLLPILLILACPLSMIFMMKGMHGGSCDHEQHRASPNGRESNQPSNQSKQ